MALKNLSLWLHGATYISLSYRSWWTLRKSIAESGFFPWNVASFVLGTSPSQISGCGEQRNSYGKRYITVPLLPTPPLRKVSVMLIQLETQYAKPKPRSVFYSYSHKDEDLRDHLDTHLTLLKREGFISTWHDRKITPGDEFDHVINESLNTSDVILFLVSPHFLASQYCRDIEIRRAMERYENREAIVIPIILKPCVWTSEAFAKLQVLPKNCRPLVEWPDTGFARVAEDLRTMMVS